MSIPLPGKPIPFITAISRPFRGWAFAAMGCVLLAAALESSLHLFVKCLIDAVGYAAENPGVGWQTVWLLTGGYALLLTLSQLTWRGSGFSGQRWLTGVEAKTYEALFEYMTGHSSSYFQDRFAGSLTNKIANASNGALSLLQNFLWQLLPLSVSFVTNTLVAFLAHPFIALSFLSWLLIILLVNTMVVRVLSRYGYRTAEASSELKGRLVDTSSNILNVQQGGHRRYEHHLMRKFVQNYRAAHLKQWWFSEWVMVTNNVLIGLMAASTLGTAVYLLSEDLITLGSVVMIITLLGSMVVSLTFLFAVCTQIVRYYSQMQEGLDELLLPHEIVDSEEASPIEVPQGLIEFRSASFSYGDNQVFDSLSLTIHSGERIGIVGPSGAGKSTFVSLLLRQFELQSGSIILDGQDISQVTMESLRKSIALVPQEVTLFHRTLLENIRYGRLDASEEEVRQAAALAQADGFIRELPEGYGTFVGERGVKLSGGQRQRIAIARAFLKDAPILILDEATSSLDSESEKLVQKALEALFQKRTVIAIAHRLSTLHAMNRILVLDQGVIKEEGTHGDLLRLEGLYARLWHSQVEGFL